MSHCVICEQEIPPDAQCLARPGYAKHCSTASCCANAQRWLFLTPAEGGALGEEHVQGLSDEQREHRGMAVFARIEEIQENLRSGLEHEKIMAPVIAWKQAYLKAFD